MMLEAEDLLVQSETLCDQTHQLCEQSRSLCEESRALCAQAQRQHSPWPHPLIAAGLLLKETTPPQVSAMAEPERPTPDGHAAALEALRRIRMALPKPRPSHHSACFTPGST
jgi:hypothetical protein